MVYKSAGDIKTENGENNMNKETMKKQSEKLYEEYKLKLEKCIDEEYYVSKNAIRYLVSEFAAELNGILSDNNLWDKEIYNWFRSEDDRIYIPIEDEYIRRCNEVMSHLTRKLRINGAWEKLCDIFNIYCGVISRLEDEKEDIKEETEPDIEEEETEPEIKEEMNEENEVVMTVKNYKNSFYDEEFKANYTESVWVFETPEDVAHFKTLFEKDEKTKRTIVRFIWKGGE
jgi:hypothetical protein